MAKKTYEDTDTGSATDMSPEKKRLFGKIVIILLLLALIWFLWKKGIFSKLPFLKR